MAIYHFACSIGSRSAGSSRRGDAVKAAAYISGTRMTNERNGQVADFRNKDVVYAAPEILLPDAVAAKHPEWKSREYFWNEVERRENRRDSQLYRSFDIALPIELSRNQQLQLAYQMADYFRLLGMAVDYGVHDEGKGNPHVHILTAMRPFTRDGEWASKDRTVLALDGNGNRIPVIDPATGRQKVRVRKGKGRELLWRRETVAANPWDAKACMDTWREEWERLANNALARAGVDTRIDHRSYADQGTDKIPRIHVGKVAHKIDRDGVAGLRGRYAGGLRSNYLALRDLLCRLRFVFSKNNTFTPQHSIDALIRRCDSTIRRINGRGANKAMYNDMIRIRNMSAEIIDQEISELEAELNELRHAQDKMQEEEYAARERDILDRLDRLEQARSAANRGKTDDAARKDAEGRGAAEAGDRKSETEAETDNRDAVRHRHRR